MYTFGRPPDRYQRHYVNDNNGNQTSRGGDTFAWDVEDRMTSTTAGGTATTSFAYNGDGLRNSRTAGGNTTAFTWDIARSTPQVLDDGAFKYVYGLERIAEVGPGATTHYYLPDGLGSTMALVNSSGTVVNTYNYDVFGSVKSSTGTQANAFKFTGEQAEVLPVVVRLPLDPVVASTNLTGATVANLDEDPDSPDTAWATATSVADTALRVGFPTPAQAPKGGPGLQEFRVLLRKNAAGGNNPSYDIELWETGGASRLALLAGGVSLTSDIGTVISATWDAALLGTANGANVEVRIVGHASSGSPSNRRTVEVGAVEWNALLNATDETLEYLRARYYDMGTGRFLSKDPLRGSALRPATQAAYSYALNNPCSRRDPSGRASESFDCWGEARVKGAGRFPPIRYIPGLSGDDINASLDVRVKFKRTGAGWVPSIEKLKVYVSESRGWSNLEPRIYSSYGYLRIDVFAESGRLLRSGAHLSIVFRVDAQGRGHVTSDADPFGFLGTTFLNEDESGDCER